MHGTEDTQGMYSVYNPDGTFYMFTISGNDSMKTSMLQCGTYVMTSDSTCNQQMVKSFTTYGAAEGQKIQVRFRMIDEKTMQWQWKLDNGSSIDAGLAAMKSGNPRWNTEIWSRVQ